MTYWQIYRTWLLKLIAERLYLSKRGFRPELKQTAKDMKNLIEFNGYRNDRTLAGFLIRRSELIEQLIPKNKAYENQINRLKTALAEGKRYMEPTLFPIC
jgi:hypothetical protein